MSKWVDEKIRKWENEKMSRRVNEEKMKIRKDSDVRERGTGSIIKTHPLISSSTHQQSSDVAIRVDHVSKKYCKNLKRSMFYGIKDITRNTLGMSSHSEKLRKDEFWALNDVSFEVKKGETLGIIGPNGSGKTTLLKLLNGIFWPDKGKITIKGRVGALIQVGAGFHPMLTGRENIYINGAILGMSKREVDKRFDSIVDFADIGNFLDTPVKYYSSGMFVRLGFAVAVHSKPDILLVDEVLAVGDAGFRARCYNAMDTIKQDKVVVFVSHNMFHVGRLADRVITLYKSQLIHNGDASEGISIYNNLFEKKTSTIIEGDVKVENFYCDTNVNDDTNINISFDLMNATTSLKKVVISLTFVNDLGATVAQCNSLATDDIFAVDHKAHILVKLKHNFNLGKYSINLIVYDHLHSKYISWYMHVGKFNVKSNFVGGISIQYKGIWSEQKL